MFLDGQVLISIFSLPMYTRMTRLLLLRAVRDPFTHNSVVLDTSDKLRFRMPNRRIGLDYCARHRLDRTILVSCLCNRRSPFEGVWDGSCSSTNECTLLGSCTESAEMLAATSAARPFLE